jgi:cytochrome c oxidase subunit II
MKSIIRYLTVVIVVCCSLYGRPPVQAQDQPRVIEIHAKRFSFTPAEITLTKGEKVTLSLTADDTTHGLLIPDLGVNVTLPKGKVTEVDVTPQEIGTFHGQCGHFCGVGHASMVFSVEVKEK